MNPFSRSAHLPDDATAAEIDAAVQCDEACPKCCFCGEHEGDPLYQLDEGCACSHCAEFLAMGIADGVVEMGVSP